MSFLPRHAVMVILGVSCCLNSVVISQTRTQKKPRPNSVSGRVTMNGKAAPGIIVGIRSSDFSEPAPTLKAKTDFEGNYQITNVPQGNYQVAPLAPALVNPEQVFPRGRSRTLLLAEGEEVRDVDFSLIRGGVITGKVTDPDGRPVVEERLFILPADQAEPRSRGAGYVGIGAGFGSLVNSFQTDDRGIYRIYGLPPGRYKISIGVSDDTFQPPTRLGRVAYRRTFYPDTSEWAEAKVIELTEGSEATNIDITVDRNLPSFAASGKIVDGETGKPVAGVRFGLRRMLNSRDPGAVMGMFIVSNQLGQFRMENITPGKYAVFIASQNQSQMRAEPVFFEVVDHDVTDLLVKIVPGFSISGFVVLEGSADKNALAKLAELELHAHMRTEIANLSSSQQSPINADGTFLITGLPAGTANFGLSGGERRPVVNFSILRIEHDGVVQSRGIEIKAGENVSGVKIVLNYGTGSVRGEVKIVNGPLPPGALLNVWLKKPTDEVWHSRPHTIDSRGHFVIEGVPAGEYELNVNANFPGRQTTASAKQLVTVNEGTPSDVVVALDLKVTPGPN